MTINRKMEALANGIQESCGKINEDSAERFIKLILSSNRVFIVGFGRSGLVGRAFGMRLMHLGFEVYIVGETITPAMKKGDLLLAVSGSGKTSYAVVVAKAAKSLGAKVAAITSHPESELGKKADAVVKVPGRIQGGNRDYAERQIRGDHEPMTPMGTMFELSCMVFLDTVVDEIMSRKGRSEAQMKKLHSNL